MKFFIAFFLCAYSFVASASCLNSDELPSKYHLSEGNELMAAICRTTESKGYVKLEIMQANRKTLQHFQVPFESESYSLDVDNSFDINLDGASDLTVST